MRHHAGGLINDDYRIVFVHNGEIDGFRLDRERRPLCELRLEHVAFGNEIAAFYRYSVDVNVAAPYRLSDQRTGKTGVVRDDDVRAFAGIFRCDDDVQGLR
jgi:hypothetical protein